MFSATPDLRLPSQPQITATAPWLVLISHPTEDRKLCWPELLITYRDEIHTNSNPSQHQTGQHRVNSGTGGGGACDSTGVISARQ